MRPLLKKTNYDTRATSDGGPSTIKCIRAKKGGVGGGGGGGGYKPSGNDSFINTENMMRKGSLA